MDNQTNLNHGWTLNGDNEYTMAVTFDIKLNDLIASHLPDLEDDNYRDMIIETFTVDDLYEILQNLWDSQDNQHLIDNASISSVLDQQEANAGELAEAIAYAHFHQG